jgi:hypothetical protein
MRVRREPYDLVHEVAEAVRVRCRSVSGASLIACEDAPAFLNGCLAAGIRVVGAEGFDLIDDNRRPDMGTILDLGDLDDPARSTAEAREFVTSVCRGGLMFEFQLARR